MAWWKPTHLHARLLFFSVTSHPSLSLSLSGWRCILKVHLSSGLKWWSIGSRIRIQTQHSNLNKRRKKIIILYPCSAEFIFLLRKRNGIIIIILIKQNVSDVLTSSLLLHQCCTKEICFCVLFSFIYIYTHTTGRYPQILKVYLIRSLPSLKFYYFCKEVEIRKKA